MHFQRGQALHRLENRFAHGIVAFAAILLFAHGTTAQVSVVGVDHIDFAWEPALGAPDGYRVSISWSGAAPIFYQYVAEPAVTVSVVPGDRLAIQVAALRIRSDGSLDVGPASELSGEVFVEEPPFENAGFDSDTDGFSYADDTFRGTAAGAYGEGVHDPQDGYTGGGLRIDLGGVDDDDILGMSGAWSNQIYLSTAKVVTIKLRTRITTSGFFESDECIESLLAINGVLGGSGGEDFLLQACGTTPETGQPSDTGWVQRTVSIWLPSGAHTIEIGGYASKKTTAIEAASVHFDDISITTVSETLFTEPTSVDFGSVVQGTTPVLTRDVAVDASAGSSTFSVSSDRPWASASPIANSTPAMIQVEVDPTGLAYGINTATLTLSGPGVVATTLPITVNVFPPGVFAATFDDDAEGFTYSDDLFRATGQPNYASGSFSSNGGYTGGGLRVNLGGVDANTVLGMSGGFSRNFFVYVGGEYSIRVRTRMVFSGDYENDECSQILVAIDGVLQGYESDDFRAELCGELDALDEPQDTSWYDETIVVSLANGSHTLTVGGYGNKKTLDNESTQIFVDDVVVEHYGTLPEPGVAVGLLGGAALLGMLSRRRRSA